MGSCFWDEIGVFGLKMTSKLLFSGVFSRECSRSELVGSWRKSFSCVELIVLIVLFHD
jgi:hypothetical protein